MMKIGITGGIGSGKTTICKVFELLGVPVFYSDVVAKEIMVKDTLLIKEIKKAFGTESYSSNGILNNKYIAQIVFNQPSELLKLNAIVHPAVFRAFDVWLTEMPIKTSYVLKEAALLFESESYKKCDLNILVTAPMAIKLQRVEKRDRINQEEIKARINKQFTDEEKSRFTDLFIRNDETKSIVLQVLSLHQQFLNYN